MLLRRFLHLIVFLCALAARLACAADDPVELAFGVISTESAAGLRQGFDPMLERLSAKLGLKVRAFYASDYTGVIEAMRFGKVHVAWMGNQAAIHAVDRAGAEIIAQTTGSDGATGYSSVIIVNAQSSYRDIDALLADASKLTFGNGDPLSASGTLVPAYYLWAPRGTDPRRAFKRTRNANHEVNALAVASGQVDAATNNTESLNRLQQRHPAAAAKLRVIWKSPEIAKDPIVCRRDLSRELKSRLQAALLAFGRIGPDAAEERELLARVTDGWGPFLAADNRMQLPFRHFEIERDLHLIETDERPDPAEKQRRLEVVRARRQKLQDYEQLLGYWNSVKPQP